MVTAVYYGKDATNQYPEQYKYSSSTFYEKALLLTNGFFIFYLKTHATVAGHNLQRRCCTPTQAKFLITLPRLVATDP